MATAGIDRKVKIYDVRTYQELHSYHMFTPATTLDISQRGMLGIGHGVHVEVWQDALIRTQPTPYMTERLSGARVSKVLFQPFEDVLTVGHSQGLRNLVIPGAGEANIDSYVANPYETTKQRQETEVKQLLDKLQPEMITLDPSVIGRVAKVTDLKKRNREEEDTRPSSPDIQFKRKMRGRGKNQLVHKKQQRATEKHRSKAKQRIEEQKEIQQCTDTERDVPEAQTALSRFH